VNRGDSLKEINQRAMDEGMSTLKQDAWDKVTKGVTTYEEAIRVTGAA